MTRQFPWLFLIMLALTLGFAGCSAADVVATVDTQGNVAAPAGEPQEGDAVQAQEEEEEEDGASLPAPEVAAEPAVPDLVSRQEFCDGSGAVIPIPLAGGGTESVCTGQIASQTFLYSLCSCETIDLIGVLQTDSFDSSQGPFMPSAALTGASVGVNSDLALPASTTVGGSLIVGGDGGLSTLGEIDVAGDTKVHGDLNTIGVMSVARDLWVEGDLTSLAELQVQGDIIQGPNGGGLQIPFLSDSVDRTETFVVDPPCACGDDEILDVPAIVADARNNNHNSEAGFDPDALRARIGDVRIELKCGRLHASEISGIGKITLVVDGRTALFVEGDLLVGADFQVELGPQGELDIFVAGSFNFVGPAQFGDVNRPAAIRMYVGGTGGINIAGDIDVGGNIYAPRAAINIGAEADIYGSLFAESMAAAGDFGIHYDADIVNAGDGCETPPGDCDACNDCPATSACVGGECGDCNVDADCCEPLVCVDGTCAPLLF